MPYLTVFYRLILRPMRQEPLRTFMTILAIGMGVAAVLAIELAGDAAAGSFHSSMETLTGASQFEVTAVGGVPPQVLARLAALPYPVKLHPRIEDYVALPTSRHAVPLIGVDLLSESLSLADSGKRSGATDVVAQANFSSGAATFQDDNSIWVGSEMGRKAGDHLELSINDSSRDFIVRGVLGDRSGELVVMDLATAAHALRRNGTLDRILIEVPEGSTAGGYGNWESILTKALPEGVTLAREGAETDENRKMLAAFRWNLRILSYVALAVGAFLIYNTISVSVVRRRFEIGILRALGTTRGGVLGAFLGEAAGLGLVGGLAGIALGRVMAVGAVKMIGATVQSLYVSSQPSEISLTWQTVLLALGIGIGVSIVSAFSPAWEASLVAPVEAMGRGRRDHEVRVHRLRNLGCATALAFCAWIASNQEPVGGRPMFGYLAAGLLIAASALAIPSLVSAVSSATASLVRSMFGAEALLATRGLRGSLRRTSVLVGALSTAVAMLVAVGIMVGSFRQTVLQWMGDQLQADLYVGPAVAGGPDRHPTLSADTVALLSKLPGVAAVDQFRAYNISYQGMPATLGGADMRIAVRFGSRAFLSGASAQSVFGQMLNADAVVISEPFANKHHIQPGGNLTLTLGGKTVNFRVIDVYYDYSNERGLVIMDRNTLLKYLPDPEPTNVAVYLEPGASIEDARRGVEDALAGRKVAVFLNRNLREEAIRVFDRTFAITYALEAVAVFVAVMGVGGALVALVIDRRREFGLLKFLGAADGQLRRIILFEAGMLGLLANLAGLILGFFLSLLLIFVINRQSFGWTIQFHWPVTVLLSAMSVVYVATLLAGIYPARIATQLIPIEVIHEE